MLQQDQNPNRLGQLLQAKFSKQYEPKAHVERYAGTWIIFFILGLAISAALALFSYKFWAMLFATKASPYIAIGAGVIATCLVIFVINILLNTIFKAWHAGDKPDAILILLVAAFIAGDVYANWHGIPALTEDMISKPIDQKTKSTDKVFSDQLASIDQQIQAHKHAFYWCSFHKTNHSQHGSCSHEKFWMPKKARAKLDELLALKNGITTSYNQQRAANISEYSQQLQDYSHKMSLRIDQLRGLQGIGYIFLIVLIAWMHKYGARSANLSPTPSPDRGKTYIEDYLAPSPRQQQGSAPGPGRIYNMHDSYTHTVEPPTHTVDMRQGAGWPAACHYCGEKYWMKRKPREGELSFCSADHRNKYHTERQRKERKTVTQ